MYEVCKLSNKADYCVRSDNTVCFKLAQYLFKQMIYVHYELTVNYYLVKQQQILFVCRIFAMPSKYGY